MDCRDWDLVFGLGLWLIVLPAKRTRNRGRFTYEFRVYIGII